MGQNLSTGINRRQFLAAAGAGIAGLAFGGCQAAEKTASAGKRPNVMVIVADDLGYGELGCYGGKEIPTPNIDAIAAGGVKFTNGYVSCPVCSPTRAGLITGRYQQRFGHEFNPGQSAAVNAIFGLPKTEMTLADRMKAAGYATGMVGKWHLGTNPGYRPTERGFDEFYGFLGGSHAYLEPGKNRTIFRGTEPVNEERFLTEAIAEEAVGFVDRHQKNPFFLYLTFNAVHAPLEVPDPYLRRFETIADSKRKTFAGMLSALDDAVGKVVGRLSQLGLENDTLIFFISDNGGPTAQITSGNGPLRGFKGQVLEGGIRVPFMMQYKGGRGGGKVVDDPVIALDIVPTCMAAAGAEVRPEWKLDGVDLLAALAKGSSFPKRNLYWRFGEAHAIRQGAWKLVVTREQPKPALYDLSRDVGEAKDLAGEQPDKVKALAETYAAWDATLVKPLWEPTPAKKAAAGKKPAAKKAAAKKAEASKP